MKEKLSKKLLDEHKEMIKNIYKPDYRDVGTCLRQVGSQQINRSKFRNEGDAQRQLDSLRILDVVNKNFVTYKCPACHMWHIGLKEWGEK